MKIAPFTIASDHRPFTIAKMSRNHNRSLDHTMGNGTSIAAVTLGASAIEKHFTISHVEGGGDPRFLLEPTELAALVIETGKALLAIGKVVYGLSETEKGSRQFRRSLHVVENMADGDAFTGSNIRDLKRGTLRHFDDISGPLTSC